jgi:flagellar basal-body rod protein FlgC
MNAITASLSGMQTAALSTAVTANNVANANTAGYKAKRLDQETTPDGGVRPSVVQESQEPASAGTSNVDLAAEAVNLKVDKTTYDANLQFMQIQSSMLGLAMDMKA